MPHFLKVMRKDSLDFPATNERPIWNTIWKTIFWNTPPVLVFHLEVYYKVDRLLTGQTAQQKGTTARWYLNKTSLVKNE